MAAGTQEILNNEKMLFEPEIKQSYFKSNLTVSFIRLEQLLSDFPLNY